MGNDFSPPYDPETLGGGGWGLAWDKPPTLRNLLPGSDAPTLKVWVQNV